MDDERRPAGLDRRPEGVDDATVEALGKLSEALEWVERARGHLYEFHQLMGHADALFGDAADLLRAAGHAEVADRVAERVVGRNAIPGRWTFQMVEEFDDGYWSEARTEERAARTELAGGVRHVYEAEMKAARITPGRKGHEPTPEAL